MASWIIRSPFSHILWYPKGTKLQSDDGMKKSYPDGFGKSLKDGGDNDIDEKKWISGFQMPLHYPKYSKADYGEMEDWKLDLLLREYGLCFKGTLDEKRAYAMGAFLWPDH